EAWRYDPSAQFATFANQRLLVLGRTSVLAGCATNWRHAAHVLCCEEDTNLLGTEFIQATLDTNSFHQTAVIKRDNENRRVVCSRPIQPRIKIGRGKQSPAIPAKMRRARSTETAAVLKIEGHPIIDPFRCASRPFASFDFV